MKWCNPNFNIRFIGKNGEGLPTEGSDGDMCLIVDTAQEYIKYSGNWYNTSDGDSGMAYITAVKITISGTDYDGVIVGKDITITLPAETVVTSLTPTITKSASSTISPTTEQDFSDPVTYTVTAADGVQTNIYKITVIVEEAEE